MYNFIVISVLLTLVSESNAWSSGGAGFPNPIFDSLLCNRKEGVKSAVCDPDGILGMDDGDRVQFVINEIMALDDDCGDRYEAAVAVVNKLEFSGDKHAAIKEFAVSLHNDWGVGSPECNTGVLFAMSIEDRVFYFSVGTGLENTITQRRIDKMDAMVNYLKDDNWGDGTVQAMLSVEELLIKGPEKPKKPSWCEINRGKCAAIITCSVVGGIGGIALLCWLESWMHGKKMKKNDEYVKHRDKIKSAYKFKNKINNVCPVCCKEFLDDDDSVTDECGHGYHVGCMEGNEGCPICTKLKDVPSGGKGRKELDPETYVRYSYLQKRYPGYMGDTDIFYFAQLSYLNGSRTYPYGCSSASQCIPAPTHHSGHTSGHTSRGHSSGFNSDGFGGGGFGGGFGDGGGGGGDF